ncbi:late embryogenesis abundant protein At1g64065-like [Typha angustifolia]|uniref:late embryogenesis abundant protein At1g64065-like n=1 Tax=Typha angustifolia TaxID=59011 RepID=UPI003C2ACB30
MAEPKENQSKPLTSNTIAIVDEESGASTWRSSQYLRKRSCAFCCCGCCALFVVLVGILILILSLTVLKVKDPTLTMHSMTVDRFNVEVGNGNQLVSANVTLIADISLKNPNVASFRFGSSATEFYYGGKTVGVGYAPSGEVGADRTARMNVTVDVLTDRIAMDQNATESILAAGELNLTSYTDISGRVNVIGIYKRDIEVMANCSLTLRVSASVVQIKSTYCIANVA